MFHTIMKLAFLIGILLQIFLSRAERKWAGWILPVISFLFSFLYPLNMSAGTAVWKAFVMWGLGNIPTFIYVAIHYACRPKRKA